MTDQIEDTTELGLLAKGAGVDIADVKWRVAAGLSLKQAVDAAIAQQTANQASASKTASASADAPSSSAEGKKKGGK